MFDEKRQINNNLHRGGTLRSHIHLPPDVQLAAQTLKRAQVPPLEPLFPLQSPHFGCSLLDSPAVSGVIKYFIMSQWTKWTLLLPSPGSFFQGTHCITFSSFFFFFTSCLLTCNHPETPNLLFLLFFTNWTSVDFLGGEISCDGLKASIEVLVFARRWSDVWFVGTLPSDHPRAGAVIY